MRWLREHSFELQGQLQQLQVTAVTTWHRGAGATVCAAAWGAGNPRGRKKTYFYPDPCTDSPNGPTSSAGITGRGREGAEHTRPLLPTSCCLTEEEVWRQGEINRTCLTSTAVERNACPTTVNRCSLPKPGWASEKSYHPHVLSASSLPGINAPHICWYSCSYVCSLTLFRLNEPGYQIYYSNYLL